jgi:hypothetical protein
MYEPAIKAEVRRLRREGYTFKEIKEKFPFLAKSTISNWTKDILLTPDQQKRILEKLLKGRLRFTEYNKQRHFNAIKKSQRIISEARKEIGKLTKRDLKLVGTALYWAEGYKKGKDQIEFTNSDPKIIVLMMRFFREILKVREDKFRLSLILHPGLNEEEIKEFWSSLTGIPISQFNKSYIKTPKSSTRKMHNPLYKGTLKIRISDTEKLHRLKGFIEGLSENI